MDVAFEIGLVFGTLLGVVLGLAGSYALSRKISITPAIWNLSSKHTGPAKSGVLLETLSDVHAQYIERATLSTTDRGAWRPTDSETTGMAKWHTMTSTDMAVHLSSPHPFDRINHPHGWVNHGADQVEAARHKLDAGTKQSSVLQSSSSDRDDKSPRIMVWRQRTLGPARQIGDLGGLDSAGDDQMAHDDVPESTVANVQHHTPAVEARSALSRHMAVQEPDLPSTKVCPAIAASSTSTDAWPQALQQATTAVLLRFEVAMKRPGHGLLKRMLRLMEVDLEYATIQDRSMKVLSLQYGAEYHIGLQILKSPLFNSSTECAAEWLSISMPGCLPLRFQVARELGADFWTGGCVWHPTNVLDGQVPHGSDCSTSQVMALTLELGLCQTQAQSQESRSVHGSTIYVRWSDSGTPRKELQQRREGSVQTEASEHLPQLLAAWRIQGDPGGSATDILLCQ